MVGGTGPQKEEGRMLKNAARRRRGKAVVADYARRVGHSGDYPTLTVIDLLADLRHYLDSLGRQDRLSEPPQAVWEDLVASALQHYAKEVAEETDDR